ncbi:hypothetical protein OROGR_009157 [Orobanche gracilis]
MSGGSGQWIRAKERVAKLREDRSSEDLQRRRMNGNDSCSRSVMRLSYPPPRSSGFMNRDQDRKLQAPYQRWRSRGEETRSEVTGDKPFWFSRLRRQICYPESHAPFASHKTLFAFLCVAAFASVFLWQGKAINGFLVLGGVAPSRAPPVLRPVVFNFTDFGGVGDGVTLNTAAFERVVSAISNLGEKGGGQLNVSPGRWLTAPFNLTSHMTLFLAEDAVILGIQDEKYWPLMPALPSYGYGREHPGPRYSSLIHGQNLRDVVITGNKEELIVAGPGKNNISYLHKCNNVLYLRGVPEDEEIEDAPAED